MPLQMDDLLRRYQLAITLVDDPDMAGDLFMASRNEADLRRRIDRWRRVQGLPPASEPQTLLPLDDDQRHYAMHLARRGALQQRLTRWMLALAAVVVLLGGGFVAYTALHPKLDTDPAFAGQPRWSSTPWRGLTLHVYKAELREDDAAGVTVSIWWEVIGPGASDSFRLFTPELMRTQVTSGRNERWDWVGATSTERFSVRPDRVLGLSRFDGYDPTLESGLRLYRGAGDEPDFFSYLRLVEQ